MEQPVLIVGAGLAGLATALALAPMPCLLLSAAPIGNDAASPLAQGGIAAAIGADDSPDRHAADTIAAGAGLCDPAVVRHVTGGAPDCIDDLLRLGVSFDRAADGTLALGLEAAHGRRRIVHAGRDRTGVAVHLALHRAAALQPSIGIVEDCRVTGLLKAGDGVRGVTAVVRGQAEVIRGRAVVIATGGVGALYASTTNPAGAIGSGVALAARAGAILRDMEFVQFHPTAMLLGRDPMPLATEALRGEGAVLVDARGASIMDDTGGNLASRDIVARSVWHAIEAGRPVFLDARTAIGADFPRRFPGVAALCRAGNIDPARTPIPVRPAAHYHMGGIAVDRHGRTSIPGLWACGEAAATGLHGANRLASNSLLEALVTARDVAADIAGHSVAGGAVSYPVPRRGTTRTEATPAGFRAMMDTHAGVVRDADGLRRLCAYLGEQVMSQDGAGRAGAMATTALLIAASALRRAETRGAHFRRDMPFAMAPDRFSRTITLNEALVIAGQAAGRQDVARAHA